MSRIEIQYIVYYSAFMANSELIAYRHARSWWNKGFEALAEDPTRLTYPSCFPSSGVMLDEDHGRKVDFSNREWSEDQPHTEIGLIQQQLRAEFAAVELADLPPELVAYIASSTLRSVLLIWEVRDKVLFSLPEEIRQSLAQEPNRKEGKYISKFPTIDVLLASNVAEKGLGFASPSISRLYERDEETGLRKPKYPFLYELGVAYIEAINENPRLRYERALDSSKLSKKQNDRIKEHAEIFGLTLLDEAYGETIESLKNRVMAFIYSPQVWPLFQKDGGKVVFGTHDKVIASLIMGLLGLSLSEYLKEFDFIKMWNCVEVRLGYDGFSDKWKFNGFNNLPIDYITEFKGIDIEYLHGYGFSDEWHRQLFEESERKKAELKLREEQVIFEYKQKKH